MRHLELTDEERSLLEELVQTSLNELQYEISHTDHADYRKRLKSRRELLERLATVLGTTVPLENAG